MLTSDPGPNVRRVLPAVWLAMTAQAVAFVALYAPDSPVIDEWEFIPVLLGGEPVGPFFWQLHNEHRFPLPRLVYVPLYRLTHDFRAGCYLSVAVVAGLAWGLTRLAGRLRGRPDWADAFFPLTLLHAGHHENWRMGYQIVFAFAVALAGLLIAVVARYDRTRPARTGFRAGGVTLLLMGCGAAGLAYGPPAALGLLLIAGVVRGWRRRALAALAAGVVGFIALYFRGYARPEWHPPSAGVWPSLDIATQSLVMAWGPALTGPWPASGFAVVAFGLATAGLLAGRLRHAETRGRAAGYLLILAAVAAVAAGIGWGRSGFGMPTAGFAPRYGWITWPAFAAAFLAWLTLGGSRWATWVPRGLAGLALGLLPFNVATGFQAGDEFRAQHRMWEDSVRAGGGVEELIARHYYLYPDYMQDRIRVGLRLLRDHNVNFYGRVAPDAP